MTDLRTAAKQALEALDFIYSSMQADETQKLRDAWSALRAALADPHQEPVAWVECDGDLVWNNREAAIGRNLYTSPQPQQTEPSQDTPPQHEYEVTANDDGTFSVGLPDGEELRIIPPHRKPLTEEELDALAIDEDGLPNSHIEFARAIERAHGITP